MNSESRPPSRPSYMCYKYNEAIRTTVLNYNKLVTEADIETIFLILETVRTLNIAINILVIYSLGI